MDLDDALTAGPRRPVTVASWATVEGNAQRLDGGAMFGNAPRAVWERWVDADEAVSIGLALRVEDDDALMTAALALAHEIAAKSAYSTRVIKQLMVAGRGDRTREARAREEALFAALFKGGGFGG